MTMTTKVLLRTCLKVGQLTFFTSLFESRKNFTTQLIKRFGSAGFFSFVANPRPAFRLLGFLVQRVLPAETTILVHFEPVRIVLLVFHRVVVALFALCACQSNLDSHFGTSRSFGFFASLDFGGDPSLRIRF